MTARRKHQAFVISPMRGIAPEYESGIAAQVEALEREWDRVYWPARDTDQRPISGLPECEANRKAMRKSAMVYVMWDGKSQGVLFDLGMAWAMGKPIQVVTGYMPPLSRGKSFQNMIYAWEFER